MVEAQLSRYIYSSISAAVIDDKVFDFVDPVDMPGQIVVCDPQCLFFVEAGDLNNEFHFVAPIFRSIRISRFFLKMIIPANSAKPTALTAK